VPTNPAGGPVPTEQSTPEDPVFESGRWVIEQKNGEKRKNIAEYDRNDYQRLADQLGFEIARSELPK
jgi:hypothetical protein